MRPTQKEYVLENYRRFSTQQLAVHLNLRERVITDFLDQELKRKPARKISLPQKQRIKHSSFFFLIPLSILGWGLILYSNSFQGGFYYDDKPWITANLAIRDITNIPNIWNFSKSRFLTALSFALNYHFGGFRIFSFHLVNIVIHILTSLGVFFLVRLTFQTPRMSKAPLSQEVDTLSWMSALIFLSHPLQTQAVTYIVQRAASLATLFYAWAVFLYGKYRLQNKGFYYALAFFAALCAMLSKEIAFTLPLMLLVYEIIFFENLSKDFPKKILIFLPFLLMMGVIPAIFIFWYGGLHSDSTMLSVLSIKETESISRQDYLLTQLNVIRTYLRLLILPVRQHLEYLYPLSRSFLEARTLLSFTLLAGLVLLAVKIYRKYRMISFGIFWFFIALSVESSIIPIRHVIFEHRVYLPMVGFSLAFCAGLRLLLRQPQRFLLICSLAVVGLSLLTYRRNKVWGDEVSLWAESVKHSPGRVSSLHNLGTAYLERGEDEKALRYLEEALRFGADSALTYNALGVIYRGRKELEKAEGYFQKAIQIDPDHFDAFINLGSLYFLDKKDLDKALYYYHRAVQKDPTKSDMNHYLLQYELGLAYYVLGDFEKALQCAATLRKLYAPNLAVSIEDLVTGKSGTHYFSRPYTTTL